jgi:hypothetical protein
MLFQHIATTIVNNDSLTSAERKAAFTMHHVYMQGFQIRPDAPFVKRVWLTFQEVPRVRFAAEAVKGMDISGQLSLL